MLQTYTRLVCLMVGLNACWSSAKAVAPSTDWTPCLTSLATLPKIATSSRRMVAYFTGWGRHLTPPYSLNDIPVSKITHLNYAFIDVNHKHPNDPTPNDFPIPAAEPPFVCTLGDNWEDDIHNLGEMHAFKVKNQNLKLLMSVGGGGEQSRHFSKAVSTPDGRATLIASCVGFMRFHGFDGIDLDWEFPGDASSADADANTTLDRNNFTLLLREFRAALDDAARTNERDHYFLTIAAPVGEHLVAQMEVQTIHPYLDWMNLMTYNFHGLWNTINDKGRTGHSAPLYPQPEDSQDAHLTIDWIVGRYLTLGVPPAKIVLGIPLYGTGWANVPNQNHGLYQTPIGDQQALAPRSRPSEPGGIDWRDIQSDYVPRGVRYWDVHANVPYLYVPASNPTDEQPGHSVFVTYDDPESACAKARYGNSHGLGGYMVWELRADVTGNASTSDRFDRNGSILDVLSRAMSAP